jgi:hypothetical protein
MRGIPFGNSFVRSGCHKIRLVSGTEDRTYGASSPRAFASFAIFAKRLRSVFTLRTFGNSTVFPASIRRIASETCLTLIGVGRSAERPIVSRPA